MLIKTMRAHAPTAKLVWATTTPLRDNKAVTYDTKADYSDERIAARNAIAEEIVANDQIPITELHEAVREHPELHSDNVHFNGQCSQLLASRICTTLTKMLP